MEKDKYDESKCKSNIFRDRQKEAAIATYYNQGGTDI